MIEADCYINRKHIEVLLDVAGQRPFSDILHTASSGCHVQVHNKQQFGLPVGASYLPQPGR